MSRPMSLMLLGFCGFLVVMVGDQFWAAFFSEAVMTSLKFFFVKSLKWSDSWLEELENDV